MMPADDKSAESPAAPTEGPADVPSEDTGGDSGLPPTSATLGEKPPRHAQLPPPQPPPCPVAPVPTTALPLIARRPEMPEANILIDGLSNWDLISAAPLILSTSPTWMAMREDEKKLFWTIFDQLKREAGTFRTDAEIYQLADIQFNLLAKPPSDRTTKEEELRLKQQRTWLEQMEKLRQDKGEVSKGISDIKEALIAVSDDDEVQGWIVKFGSKPAVPIEPISPQIREKVRKKTGR